jgi:hypothetical protein
VFDVGITTILIKHGPLKTLQIYIAFNDADIANVGVPYIRNWLEQIINRGVEIVEVKCFMLDDGLFDPVMLPVELLT